MSNNAWYHTSQYTRLAISCSYQNYTQVYILFKGELLFRIAIQLCAHYSIINSEEGHESTDDCNEFNIGVGDGLRAGKYT